MTTKMNGGIKNFNEQSMSIHCSHALLLLMRRVFIKFQRVKNPTILLLKRYEVHKKGPHYKRSSGVLKFFILLQFLTVCNSYLQWGEYLDLIRNRYYQFDLV